MPRPTCGLPIRGKANLSGRYDASRGTGLGELQFRCAKKVSAGALAPAECPSISKIIFDFEANAGAWLSLVNGNVARGDGSGLRQQILRLELDAQALGRKPSVG